MKIKTPSKKFLPVAAAALAFSGAALAGPQVYGESEMVKVRPSTPAHADSGVSLTAARNEFASFQVVVNGADTGATGVSASIALNGPSTISGGDLALFREAYLNIKTASFPNTPTGQWPDALIPDVDEIAHEKRNAFPFNVPAGESRAIWVDVHVPQDAQPGTYTGAVTVTGSNLSYQVPVTLKVVNATLPSTSSLQSAFLLFSGNVCQAHTGSSDCGGDANKQIQLMRSYEKLALNHRLTLSNIFDSVPTSDWTSFDTHYAPLLNGTADTILKGAQMTTAQYVGPRGDPSHLKSFTDHFTSNGWLDKAYDYTADEPPYGTPWATVASRAQAVHQAAPTLRTLVTTTYPEAQQQGLLGDIDILTPVVNFIDGVEDPFQGDQRATYVPYLKDPNKRLWLYQSCMSQGCGYGTTAPGNTNGAGWPSYLADASSARNRAMQWVEFKEDVSGELYYETALALPSAWTDIYRFNGNGDGTMFLPGTPAQIGGTTDIPVSNIRLKMLRNGMQDFEWLKLVSDAGDAAFAKAQAATVAPTAHTISDDGSIIEKAHAALVNRYVELKPAGSPSDSSGSTSGGSTSGGTSGGTSSGSAGGSTTGSGSSGSNLTPGSSTSSAGKTGCSSTGGSTFPMALLMIAVTGLVRRGDTFASAKVGAKSTRQ